MVVGEGRGGDPADSDTPRRRYQLTLARRCACGGGGHVKSQSKERGELTERLSQPPPPRLNAPIRPPPEQGQVTGQATDGECRGAVGDREG